MVPLGSFRTDANRGFGVYYAFVALQSKAEEGHVRTGDLESVSMVRLKLKEVDSLLATNAFKEVKWSNTVSLAVNYVKFSQDHEARQFRQTYGLDL